jgi:hypothetical protein
MLNKSVLVGLVSLLFIGCFLGISGSVIAQDEFQASGYVYVDGESRSIDGAKVVFESHDNSGQRYETWTDNSGYYSIRLSEGSYSISVSADGYNSDWRGDVYVSDGFTQDFYLSPNNNDDGGDGDGGFFFDDGGGDGDGDKDGDEGGDSGGFENVLPPGLGDNVSLFAGLCLVFIILIIVSFVILACASLGIFVRLGKIKKDINKLSEKQANNGSQRENNPPPRNQRYDDYPPRKDSRPDDYPLPRRESRPDDYPPPRDSRADDYPPPPPPPPPRR